LQRGWPRLLSFRSVPVAFYLLFRGELPAGLAADVANGLLGRVFLGHGSYLLSESRTLSSFFPRFGPNSADGKHLAEQNAHVNKTPLRILKLSFTYRREIDDTEFSISKLYWISENGDSLTDFDAPGTVSDNIMVTERIKSLLNAPASR
jgi:hypothetical protein